MNLDKKLKPVSVELQKKLIEELKSQRDYDEESRSDTMLIRVTPGVKERLKQIAEWKTSATGNYTSVSALAFEYVIDGIELDTQKLLR